MAALCPAADLGVVEHTRTGGLHTLTAGRGAEGGGKGRGEGNTYADSREGGRRGGGEGRSGEGGLHTRRTYLGGRDIAQMANNA